MTDDHRSPVAVSRRIAAPAAEIFAILADPTRHLELDGSGMLRGAESTGVVTAVGDVFVMNMYFSAHGEYQMDNHVVVYERDRRIGWEPAAGLGHPDGEESDDRWGHRWIYDLVPDGANATVVTESYDCSRAPADEQASMDGGRVWLEAMAATLERLEQAVSSCSPGSPAAP